MVIDPDYTRDIRHTPVLTHQLSDPRHSRIIVVRERIHGSPISPRELAVGEFPNQADKSCRYASVGVANRTPRCVNGHLE